MASTKWSRDALEDLEHIDPAIAKRIVQKISWLGENFSSIVPERLREEFSGLYKLRVGDYRVVYAVHDNAITIEAVGHRRDIYK